ncbi:MAG: hypothetical protein AAF658_19510, partial [Myxococcota bacterium]
GTISLTGNEPLEFIANFDGLFFIEAVRTQNAGLYALTLERTAANPDALCDDPLEDTNGRNDTVETAALINDDSAPLSDCTVNGALGGAQTVACLGNPARICLGEPDFFLIDAPVGATVIANVNGSTGDLNARLYGPYVGDEPVDTSRLADASTSVGTNEQVQDQSRTGGRYALEIFRFTGSDPTYSLSITIEGGASCIDDAFDLPGGAGPNDPPSFNDVAANATTLALTPDMNGEATLSVTNVNVCALDVDWYRIVLDGDLPIGASQELVATVRNVSPAPDSNVVIFGGLDPSALDSEVAAQIPVGNSLVFSARPTSAGSYFIAVRPLDLTTGTFDYELDVTLRNPPACTPDASNNAASTAQLLDSSGGFPEGVDDPVAREADLNLCIDDFDYYRVALGGDERLVASIFYDPTVADLAMRGYDPTVVGADTPSGERVP